MARYKVKWLLEVQLTREIAQEHVVEANSAAEAQSVAFAKAQKEFDKYVKERNFRGVAAAGWLEDEKYFKVDLIPVSAYAEERKAKKGRV